MSGFSEAERSSVLQENYVKDNEETALVNELILIGNNYLYLVHGTDRGMPAYHHVLVDPENIIDFLHAPAGGSMDVDDYGTIVQSGYGRGEIEDVTCSKVFKDLMIYTGYKGKFDGAWYYVSVEHAVKKSAKCLFDNLLETGFRISNLLPTHFKILHAGWGRDPPESIAYGLLATHFGIIQDGNGLEISFPCLSRLHRDARYRQSELFTIAKFKDGGCDVRLTNILCDKNHWTLLHHAAFGGDIGIVQFLIENGANIDAKDYICGRKPIHIAAREGSTAVLKLFLRSGVSIDEVDHNEWTPLHYAAWAGHEETVNLLIKEGAATQSGEVFNGMMPIHLGAREGHIEVVQSFIAEGMFVDEPDRYGRTPLYYAACSGQFAIVKYLVDNMANMDAETDDSLMHRKPIHVAAANGYTDVIEFFLNRHEFIDDPCRENGWTPLHNAACYGHEETVRFLLIKGADIEAECQQL